MECNHPNDGSLLTQYMLNLLNEEDRCRFEEHLMNCESCRLALLKANPELAAIGAHKERIVQALHKEGISFESLRKELMSSERKKGILQEFLTSVSVPKNWLLQNKRVAFVMGTAVIVLLTALLLKGPVQDNPYIPLLSFDKFVYQELTTRDQASATSVDPLFLEGMKLYNDNDYKNAAKIFKNATLESPHKWSSWFFLGVSYYLDKQAEPAITALLEADNLNQYSLEIEIKWYLAQSHLLNNDPDSALPYLLWLQEKPGDYSSKTDILIKAIQKNKDASD